MKGREAEGVGLDGAWEASLCLTCSWPCVEKGQKTAGEPETLPNAVNSREQGRGHCNTGLRELMATS